ncbi:MAG: flagella basal body P-ring formation protein FlgA [Rhodospirillales bacterium 20-64-7]|nr:MAG: flagella basal body P-ring formation protein FlgA [Rhodospirillales bacterium 20-64-7]HQT75715.1 flagellar basal body P-ring formation chaperone FlgA [Rhodopila sp.]
MTRIRSLYFAGAALLALCQVAAAEDVWHAVHTLVPGDIVRGDDVVAQAPSGRQRNIMPASAKIIGLEVKRRIYAGHDVDEQDVGAVTAVKASTTVTVLWKRGNLSLELEGRALDAGAIGDEVRVLNPVSLRTIRGTVTGEGIVEVNSAQ